MRSAVETVARLKPEVKEVVTAVACNKCGRSEPRETWDSAWPDDFHRILVVGGWGDKFPGDLCALEVIVCGDCLREWCGTFAIPVEPRYTGPGARDEVEATHSETGEVFVVEDGWARPRGTELPEGFWSEDAVHDPPVVSPEPGVYRHFKGELYHVVGYVRTVGTREPLVLYQALYGESKVWLRPPGMWAEEVERDGYKGPRFVPIR